MMGTRSHNSGDERSAFSRKARACLTYRAGERAAIKRRHNKRARKIGKCGLFSQLTDEQKAFALA